MCIGLISEVDGHRFLFSSSFSRRVINFPREILFVPRIFVFVDRVFNIKTSAY